MNERVENYFERKLSTTEKVQFEADLKSDPELADAVAFYLTAKEAAFQEVRSKKVAERHEDWKTLRKSQTKFATLSTWYAVAAAVALIAFGLFWHFLMPAKQDMQELASGYVMENFTTLNVQMGGGEDSIQAAINSYNSGQYATATKICVNILERDSLNVEAKKIAGIVSLKLLEYDKAIAYFHQLGLQQNLYANPGKFYEAIALLQRGLPLDKKKAEDLLKEVIDSNLEGKEEAMKWME